MNSIVVRIEKKNYVCWEVQHLPHFFGQIVLTMKHQNGLMMRQKGRLSRQVSGALVVTVPPPPPLPPSDLPHTIPGNIEYVFFAYISPRVLMNPNLLLT